MSRSIRISDELWAELKTRSVALRTTLQKVVEEAAVQYLALSAALRSSGGSDAPRFHEMPGGTYRPGETFRIGPPIDVETGSVAEKNESAARRGSVAVDPDPFHEINETTAREVARGRAEDAARPVDRTKPLTSPISYERLDDTRCGRCQVPWKNHQEGSRKNRAATTGCTRFEDPS